MNLLRAEAIHQAERMLQLLDEQRPGARKRLQNNPIPELHTWDDVQIRLVPETQTDARCSVAGGYVHSTTPPTLTITTSASVRRRGFTALHELGHHLQQNDVDLAVAARAQPADAGDLEDAACDAFAARTLIPDALLHQVMQNKGPTAADVVTLFELTQASRAACGVRATERLTAPGIVVLLDPTGRVSFASGRGGIYPPARGSDQASTAVVAAALATGRDATRDDTRILYRNASTSDLLYGQAAWCDGYLVVVAVSDRAPWRAFAPPRPGTARFTPRPTDWCELCDEEFPVEDRCGKCGRGYCPARHCGCTTARERMCQTCFLVKHPSQFTDATTSRCKECTS